MSDYWGFVKAVIMLLNCRGLLSDEAVKVMFEKYPELKGA